MRNPPRQSRARLIDFVLWMQSQPALPSPIQVSTHLQISLDSARRWRNAWLARKRA